MNTHKITFNSILPNFLGSNALGIPIFPPTKYAIINDIAIKTNFVCPICFAVP